MESSDDPLGHPTPSKPPGAPRKSQTRRLFLEKRESNPFDVSNGDAIIEEDSPDELYFNQIPKSTKKTTPNRLEVVQETQEQRQATPKANPVIETAPLEIDKDLWVSDGEGNYMMRDEDVELEDDEDNTLIQHADKAMTMDGNWETEQWDMPQEVLTLLEGVNAPENEEGEPQPVDFDKEDEQEIEIVLSDGPFVSHTSDDDLSFYMKTPEEQQEIETEMEELKEKIPELQENYELLDRLGTGTFSSVFKAIDRRNDEWDNRLWDRNASLPDPTAETAPKKPTYVAIKRILELIKGLNITGIRQYFRCLFRALRDIHARGIIHRDLKPANFLFDPIAMTGTLVDFGLAETFTFETSREHKETGCLHTGPSTDAPHGRLKDGSKYSELLKKSLKASRSKSDMLPEYIGWPTDDTRPALKANRAGTRGFRAPEVLFKCVVQTPAVDIWSAGTILLFFLSKKWPIFAASSDMHALLEQALILGKDVMEQCAALHCRTFSTNIPEVGKRVSWPLMVKTLNPSILDFPPPPWDAPNSPEEVEEQQRRQLIVDALDLLEKCLEPISVHRIEAKDALYHPFLAPDAREIEAAGGDLMQLEDDAFFPHPFGEGICGKYHQQDPNTGDLKVFVGADVDEPSHWIDVEAGEDATERELKTLFGTFGIVERVAFAGHERVKEILDEEAKADDEEMQEEDVEMESDGDENEDEQVTSKSKRRREKPTQAPKVIPLPIANLRHIRKTGEIGHLVFTSPQAVKTVLSTAASDLPLNWPKFKANSAAEPSGLAHYAARHKALRPSLHAVKEHADSSMEVFEYKQAQESRKNSKYRKGEAIVDEDGFTLVTRGGAYGQTLGGGVRVASKKFMQEVAKSGGKRNRKKKNTNKEGLYAFQLREKRIKEQIELKRAFDADREKYKDVTKKGRFKPY
ncbi:hypothetical protein FRC17_010463 [Serendipita sp. 399]|nr:hypothetical protein FRC17_010463 [Serendipita sp. 399]